MPKTLDGRDKKKQKAAATPTTKEKDVSEGEGVSSVHLCALCGVNCSDDRVGVSKPQPVEKGSVVFHKACRDEIFASKWWKGMRPKCHTLKLSKNKQWQIGSCSGGGLPENDGLRNVCSGHAASWFLSF